MMAKPIRALELHYQMIQFFINEGDTSQGYCSNKNWIVHLLIHKIVLLSYEESIKQIASGSTNQK